MKYSNRLSMQNGFAQSNEGQTKGNDGSLKRSYHLGCPGARLVEISRSPVDAHLLPDEDPAFSPVT
jgi:hypothetical protein